ncbi:hypothetical protein OSB04_020242 [Centaurea solstitialis]|uniref:Uncharacterized protein n=1 Tax=Centaurea solstitialis TaxID=347529 RepID=A0AA38WF16_9ASTR|nr:hypothetical protein OSB04_020242 [Centaurea solstitialis]
MSKLNAKELKSLSQTHIHLRQQFVYVLIMDKQTDAPGSIPESVIGSEFMASYPFDITVHTYSGGNLMITDINDKLLIRVKPCNTTFHNQRVLLDTHDTPIVVLREKNMTEHGRWNVFRGNTNANSDLLFTTKTTHLIQRKTSVDVFLTNKKSCKDDCDFKIKGNWSERNCTIYMGDSSTTIAQMQTAQPLENAKFAGDKFVVRINPNVDYAFVVSLIAIVDAMNCCGIKEKLAVQVLKKGGGVLGEVLAKAIVTAVST